LIENVERLILGFGPAKLRGTEIRPRKDGLDVTCIGRT
jgi:hypothetical protein